MTLNPSNPADAIEIYRTRLINSKTSAEVETIVEEIQNSTILSTCARIAMMEAGTVTGVRLLNAEQAHAKSFTSKPISK